MREKVISIDPAPSKESTICDGKSFCEKKAPQLRTMLEGVGPNTLICWDAPLTGPQNPDQSGKVERDFSQRCIDGFFSQGATGFKTPAGISVRPYSGCSHWTITRSLLGLPRTGPHDAKYEDLPFHLLPGEDRREAPRPAVVETHPAVAAWLWCRRKSGFPKDTERWPYKTCAGLREKMWDVICNEARGVDCLDPDDDDDFDAAVGYLLARLYLRDRNEPESARSVVLLGKRQTGSFLVPNVKGILPRWDEFVNEWPRARSR